MNDAAMSTLYDVVVIGGGNAALCAAISAQEAGGNVLVIERAPHEHRGGNSAYTGGAFRIAYDGANDLVKLMPDLHPDELRNSDFGTYTKDQFYDEVIAMSGYRADADVLHTVVQESLPTMLWLTQHGVRFVPLYGRQAFKVDGKHKFWGGLTVEVSGGGLGLMQTLYKYAEKSGIHLRYATRAVGLTRTDHGWSIEVETEGAQQHISTKTVVMATGGFHANLKWRSMYLGPNWDMAKVRGSRYNTGDGIDMAINVGGVAHGHWTGCHAVFYDLNAPPYGDIKLLNQQKNYFSLGIVVNAEGQRFVDEGSDFRNYIYSGMGAKVLTQPGAIAWQIFDAKTSNLLPDEYRVKHATRYTSDTLEGLIAQFEGIHKKAVLQTISAFNQAVDQAIPFNPAVLDGRGTKGLAIPKSNWAQPLDTGPFVAYAVTCGITCTYGGVKINPTGQVLDEFDQPISGLYAAGEMVGGLYYTKYAGGAGLTAGSVLGRISGEHAANLAKNKIKN